MCGIGSSNTERYQRAMALKSLITIIIIISMPLPFITAMAFPPAGGGILGLFDIQGLVYCSPDGNVGANGTATQAFVGAEVQLLCGGNMVSSSLTNSEGKFEMWMDPVNYLLSTLLSNCNLQVTTPLNTCNATLPGAGGLVSALAFVGNTIVGALLVSNLIPAGFQYVPSL